MERSAGIVLPPRRRHYGEEAWNARITTAIIVNIAAIFLGSRRESAIVIEKNSFPY